MLNTNLNTYKDESSLQSNLSFRLIPTAVGRGAGRKQTALSSANALY